MLCLRYAMLGSALAVRVRATTLPCAAFPMRTRALPSLCVALPLRVSARPKRRPSQPCARSVATAVRCFALPWLCYAKLCPRRACQLRATPSPRTAKHSCANARPCLADRCFAIALPCLAVALPRHCCALPSRCAARPSGALPLRRHASLSRCARCAALCRRLAGCRGALPLRSVGLLCPCDVVPSDASAVPNSAPATGA